MKSRSVAPECSLQEAHAVIAAELSPLSCEKVPLPQALGRVNAETLFAAQAEPSCSQATRDGFALADQPAVIHNAVAEFQIEGEQAAGCTKQEELQAGQAYRIMTGAMLPCKTARVVPFEVCQEKETGRLFVPEKELRREQLYIRSQGQNIKEGERLLDAGIRLCSDDLLLLAESGLQQIRVSRCPRVAVLCTGSELVGFGENSLPGQKISTNEILLASLLQEQGCRVVRSIRVQDNLNALVEQIEKVFTQDRPDLLITTGGTGPGKFDLMEQAVASLQGDPLYNLLNISPGKSTLFAMIRGLPLFALPGPPPAARLLFHELVIPGLHRLQGLARANLAFGDLHDATLTESVRLRRPGYLTLKAARATLCSGQVQVRPAKKKESMNAIMHLFCSADVPDEQYEDRKKGKIEKNQVVKVRLIRPLTRVK
jgi:molybdopterin molybdotransferase